MTNILNYMEIDLIVNYKSWLYSYKGRSNTLYGITKKRRKKEKRGTFFDGLYHCSYCDPLIYTLLSILDYNIPNALNIPLGYEV